MNSDAVFRFDRYELQVRERRLLHEGRNIHLGGRSFDLLVALVERAGRLVTKSELLDLVWPGLIVEENNVPAQVATLRKALPTDLVATVPGQGYRLEAALRADASLPGHGVPCSEAQDPPARGPRLFGRDEDLARLSVFLAGPGLTTLVGPGGVGKTAMARAVHERWSGPSLWIELADVGDADRLLPTIARALGVANSPDQLMRALAVPLQRIDLLVLDNAEHILGAVASWVGAALATAPGLRILVTSQAPLAIEREKVERIEPLERPEDDLADAEALNVASLMMFTQRIREADARFQVTSESIPTLRRLCAALDGLPLVLEMAAARVPLLGLQRVEDALAERFSLLRKTQRDAPSRHRTLQATLSWSYELLSAAEKRAFRALGIFSGGFTTDLAAQALGHQGDAYWDAVDRLATLVDRSLVSTDHADPPRYWLLETMRSYARAELAREGEEQAVRARHAEAMDRLLTAAADGPTANDDDARRLASREMDNAREAIAWARTHDASLAARLSSRAANVALLGPWRFEAWTWLASCKPLVEQGLVEPVSEAIWRQHFATHSVHEGSGSAVEAAHRAIVACRAVGDEWNLTQSLLTLAWLLDGATVEVDQVFAEARALCAAHREWAPRVHGRLLQIEGRIRESRGDYESALSAFQRQVAHARESGLLRWLPLASINAANMLQRLGRYDEALEMLRFCIEDPEDATGYVGVFSGVLRLRILSESGRHAEALAEMQPIVSAARRLSILASLELAALVLVRAGHPQAAARMVGHAQRSFEERDLQVSMDPQYDIPRTLALIRADLEDDVINRLVDDGRALDAKATDALMREWVA